MMSSFYCSLRFFVKWRLQVLSPIAPSEPHPSPLFPPSHLKVNEACWGSCHSQHNVSTYPRFHPRVFPRNHDVYSVLSEYTRHILCIIWVYTTYTLYYLSIHDVYPVGIPTLPPHRIPDRRIPMYTHPQIFPITPNPSLRHSYKCQFLPLAH